MQLTSNWQLFSVTFTAAETTAAANFLFGMGDTLGDIWIDAVQLVAVPPAAYRRDFTNGVAILNGTPTSQTVLEPGFQRFKRTEAPLYQYIIDDIDPGFTFSGSWNIVGYDTGVQSGNGGRLNPPWYHAWNLSCHQLDSEAGTAQWDVNVPSDGQYTLQVWLPAAPGAGGRSE